MIDQEPQIGKASALIPYQGRGDQLDPERDEIVSKVAELVEEIKDEFPDAEIKDVEIDSRKNPSDTFQIEATFK